MARNNSGSPSASNRRRGSRTFKARRALIACQRCRRLKKSCQPTEQERCLRCCLSEQGECIYMDVANDPSAPRATVVVPDSPTISPESPLTPSRSYPSDPHAITSTRIRHPPFHYTHPMHHPNPQSGGLSPSMPIFAPPPPIYPPDVFSSHQFDPTFPSVFGDDLYGDESGVADTAHNACQTPPPFMTIHQHSAEDMVDPPYPHRYLRSTPNPSLVIHNHFDSFTIAPSSLNTASFLQDFSPVASTSNHNMSMSSQSPMLYSPSSKMPYVKHLNTPSVKVNIGARLEFFLLVFSAATFALQVQRTVLSTPQSTATTGTLPPKMIRMTEEHKVPSCCVNS